MNKKKRIFGGGALFITAWLIFGMCAIAFAQGQSISGKVVAIDKDTKTLVIDPFREGQAAGVRTFSLGDNASVMMEGRKTGFETLSVGDLVTATYHSAQNGENIIDGITVNSKTPEEQG